MNAVTLATLQKMKQQGERFTVLTAYDASFAAVLDEAGIDVILVGDSLGMVVQGHDTTLPVSMEDMIYHTRMVGRRTQRALVLADMPFMSYNTPQQALENAGRLMKEGGAHAVKLEGGAVLVDTVAYLAARGIPVCAHLGLLPQSVNKLGGYRVQGRASEAAEAMVADARAMETAGADMLLLEAVPAPLAERITRTIRIPTIGIGAGPGTDAQVLVLYDMLGITPGKRPKFSHDFLAGKAGVRQAVEDYVQAVKSGAFPDTGHSYS